MLLFSLGLVSGAVLVIGFAVALVAALTHNQHEPPSDGAASRTLLR